MAKERIAFVFAYRMLPANTFHNLSLYDNTESALPLWGIEAAHSTL